jgi:hypothetical protein
MLFNFSPIKMLRLLSRKKQLSAEKIAILKKISARQKSPVKIKRQTINSDERA